MPQTPNAPPPEIPLTGGNVSLGVVRVGDTLRKPTTAHTTTVQSLLDHLHSRDVPAIPRHHGLDDQGRQMLDFLPGETTAPGDIWDSTRTLIAAARILRQIHDATVDLLPTDPAKWAFAHPDPAQQQVICHNDFAPYNMVFQNGLPTGIIDWDLAGPGPRLRDLAYLAYWMVPLSFTSGDMADAAHRDAQNGHPRLHLVCEAYGTDDIPGLWAMTAEVLRHMGRKTAATAMIGADAAQRLEDGGHFAHWQAERRAFLAFPAP